MKKQNKKKLVVLKVTKFLSGHDENGVLKREVNTNEMEYDTIEYHNFMKHYKRVGFNSVEFHGTKTFDDDKGEYVYDQEADIDIKKDVEYRISLISTPFKEESLKERLDRQQKQIEEQQKQIAELLGRKSEEKKSDSKPKQEEDKDADYEKASREYQELFGKKPFHTWDTEQINKKIEEHLNA